MQRYFEEVPFDPVVEQLRQNRATARRVSVFTSMQIFFLSHLSYFR